MTAKPDTGPDDQALEPPNSFVFSLRQCGKAYKLNQFAIGLQKPEKRAEFVEDERAAMAAAGLSDEHMDMVTRRDWSGLVAGGGHILAVVKIAYSLGILHHEVGAHMCGRTYEEMKATLPRLTDRLPEHG